jgi:hypothetical protein
MGQFYKIRDLAYPNAYDGEYDIFSYNIFGNSGSFYIKNGQVLLINNDNSVKIQITHNAPYYFVITDSRGYKYFFDGETERTEFSPYNACDGYNPFLATPATTSAVTKISSIQTL